MVEYYKRLYTNENRVYMPIVSKYDNQKIELILTELLEVLEKHRAPTDLSLMLAGNLATHIINRKLSGKQRDVIAEKFAQTLLSSIEKE